MAALTAVALFLTSFGSNPTNQRTVEGPARIRDVDTIVVQGVPVRLNGVDGPELSTSAGIAAKRWMADHLRGKIVTCKLSGERTYDRWVGVCFVDGVDIGAASIAAGHALDCRRYSGGRYRHLETPGARARIVRAGYC
ncbi:thermonuclease family protein [Ruegeria sp. AD91A]|uniref:thermonuclease family protein n=1 Tax=Ruegeria sp. AD91A TaxID=2293862 RepID=UPI0020C7AA69|nr:thermonuclease family protein [Ruegeria sp. AD91A]